MATVVLTSPIGGGESGVPGTVIADLTIPALTTVVVDTLFGTNPNYISTKWIYTLIDEVDQTVITAEVVANQRFAANPQWNRYGLVGDRMLHGVDVVLNAGNMELHVTNNHALNSYTANIVRIEASL